MWQYRFTEIAFKQIKKLPILESQRIITKLDFFCKQENPLKLADYLTDFRLGSYRFRIGDYRVIFDVKDEYIVVLAVGHRRDIYRKN